MKCPSCQAVLPKPFPQCPWCKLSVATLDTKFGIVPQYSRFLTDHSGQLQKREVTELRQLLRLFNRKFPQSVFSVFLSNQIPEGVLSEYTFWLANRVRFNRAGSDGGDNFDLLLVIDSVEKLAALNAGYGLEDCISERDLEVGSSRVDLQACKLEYSIVSPK